MKTLIILILSLTIPFNLAAYSYKGSWSEADIFGNYNYRDSEGNFGTMRSEPDIFGNHNFSFSDGTSGYIKSQPDIFGDTNIYIR